jgi:hypothetical protein
VRSCIDEEENLGNVKVKGYFISVFVRTFKNSCSAQFNIVLFC